MSRHLRLGICGGPYANPYALDAFVEDAKARGCQRLYCLGDLGGFGAEIDALWQILLENNVVCVAGNYDVAIARGDPNCGCGYRDPRDNEYAQLIYDYTRTHTSPAFAAWMGSLPTERRQQVAGVDLHLVHGSPLALNDFWWDSLPDEEHELRATTSGADVICCTHSGLPWQRRVGRQLVVNVGVLGKPANDGRREVWYATIDICDRQATADLVPLSYDWSAQAISMRSAGLPEPLVETIETGWWTTCIEVLPPTERARGRYHLYRSSLPRRFPPVGDTWGAAPADDDPGDRPVATLFGSAWFPARLWICTNFHCNLSCDYCAVASSPQASTRALAFDHVRSLVDEALAEGFQELYFTGGEPFLHPEIIDMLTYAAERTTTVVLTNAMLLGQRREGLDALAGLRNFTVQISLDGASPATHDARRGAGSFARAIEGLRLVVELGLAVRVVFIETPENSGEVPAVRELLARLGLPPEIVAVHPLLRRGFSVSGLDVSSPGTVPELTVTAEGLAWHPAAADRASSPDMHLAGPGTTLAEGKRLVTERFLAEHQADGSLPRSYRCAV